MFHFLSGDVHENVYVNEGPAASEPCWQGCWFAAVPSLGRRWDSTKLVASINHSDCVSVAGLKASVTFFLLRLFSWLRVPLFPVWNMGPLWLAAIGAIRWHMSRSPATTCRRFDAAGLSDPWFEGNEVVWMVLNESTWRWWEKICLWIFLEFELGMPLVAVQVAYINEANQPEGNQLPEVWLGSRFCGPWVCRCLFYFTFQWFLYYQDDLPISSLSNVYEKCFQFFHDLLAGIPRRTKLPVEALLVTLVCAKCIPAIDVSISRCGWVEWLSIFVYWRWCINGHNINTYIYI